MNFDYLKFKTIVGGSSVVFINETDKKAYKLFKSILHSDKKATGEVETYGGISVSNDYFTKIFKTEIDAYESIQNSDLLKKFTPAFFGKITIKKVSDGEIDISDQFLLDCCYCLEYVPGANQKLGWFDNSCFSTMYGIDYSEIEKEFYKLGVNFLIDAQIIYSEKRLTIIDFATTDFADFQPHAD